MHIVDLSRTGFRARCDAKVITGLPVHLEIAGIGLVEATVTWRRGTVFGAEFRMPVDLSACSWTEGGADATLARLLVQRAAARTGGDLRRERELRRQILDGLPMIKPETPGSAARNR